MTYLQPDPVNAEIIKWATRAIVLSLAIALVAGALTLALRALALLGSTIVQLAQTIPSFIGSIDPLIMIMLFTIASIAMLMLGKKFVLGTIASLQGGMV